MPNEKKPGKSRALAAKVIYAAMGILRDNAREMPMRELMARVENEVELSDWAKERYEKSGYIRWESILHFFSIRADAAGSVIPRGDLLALAQPTGRALPEGQTSHLQAYQEHF